MTKYIITIGIGFFLCLPKTIALGHQSIFDAKIPSQQKLDTSLEIAKRLSTKDSLTADESVQIYFAEKVVGRSVWGVSDRDSSLYARQRIAPLNYYLDRALSEQCSVYVQKNRTRFKVVPDGWKGDENFCEPNRYWLDKAKKYYSGSMQALQIEFDLEFNEFIRHFDIDEDAKGKTCQQHHQDDMKDFLDMYLDFYSKEEIDLWPAECERNRDEFVRGRARLLERYKNAPFTKPLQDIDQTTIVVHHSVC